MVYILKLCIFALSKDDQIQNVIKGDAVYPGQQAIILSSIGPDDDRGCACSYTNLGDFTTGYIYPKKN